MDKEIALYQWISTCLMWADALTKEMDMHDELKEVLMEGNLRLKISIIRRDYLFDLL